MDLELIAHTVTSLTVLSSLREGLLWPLRTDLGPLPIIHTGPRHLPLVPVLSNAFLALTLMQGYILEGSMGETHTWPGGDSRNPDPSWQRRWGGVLVTFFLK